MTAPGRLATALAVVAVSVALLFARTPTEPARPVPTVSFSAMGLSFRYPATWHARTWNDVSSFTASIVYLSTGRQYNPCTITYSPGEKSVTCTSPVSTLPPGGVLVQWSADGFPGFRLPKPDATIAGRPALETRTSGGWCASLGGTETITVTIPRDAPDNLYQMQACLSAPNLPQQEAQISAMLHTVRIAAGD
ncbi:MAG: hypothetical protein ACRDOA_16260 [Streptosporangiaceae bacterium]